ncbi:hypothetical protein TNCV_1460841 [Trichonephila clavipes]|nr:hypothetical protein TNCV_1460841 [Trichonephila clavipes]
MKSGQVQLCQNDCSYNSSTEHRCKRRQEMTFGVEKIDHKLSLTIHGCVHIGTMRCSIGAGKLNADIYQQMGAVYGEHCPVRTFCAKVFVNSSKRYQISMAMMSQTSAMKYKQPYKIPLKSVRTSLHSLDLSPRSLSHFKPLKRTLRFYLDDEVKEAKQDSLENQPSSFYSENIDLLSKRSDLCYNAHDDLFRFPIKVFFLFNLTSFHLGNPYKMC